MNDRQEKESCIKKDKKMYENFYNSLPAATECILDIFKKYKLNQKQAAFSAACALNKICTNEGIVPKTATVILRSAYVQDS